jgi:hypothetical protein
VRQNTDRVEVGAIRIGRNAAIQDDALSPYTNFILLAAIGLTACGPGYPTKSGATATVAWPGAAAMSTENEKLADAMKLVADKDWPKALIALRAVIEAEGFLGFTGEVQYRTLQTAGRVAYEHGQPEVGYKYLVRVTSLPQAGFDDWHDRITASDRLGNDADTIRCLTLLAQRWPDRIPEINAEYILRTIEGAGLLPGGEALPLLQALYAAHWKLKGDLEPSGAWRELVLLLVEKGRVSEAVEVSGHISNVYALIAMRADRRFDAVVAADPAQFDIEVAAERELQELQAASEKTPDSLQIKCFLIRDLLLLQHYQAALAASDALLLDIRSTNYPRKLYWDYDKLSTWFFNLRSAALERVGRWDEAVAQLVAAALLQEDGHGNVSQLINLGELYSALGRPNDALTAIGRVESTSASGAMEMESIRLGAAFQVGDSKQVARSLEYLGAHRIDAPATYEDALIVVDQPDRAAQVLIGRLLDEAQRRKALLSVQTYAPTPGTPLEMLWHSRRRAIIARSDVQAAIKKVGRVESYNLEED